MSKCTLCGKNMGFMSTPVKVGSELSLKLERSGLKVGNGEICTTCAENHIDTKEREILKIFNETREKIKTIYQKLNAITTITIPHPQEWNAEIKGLVSGHSVVGTGPLSTIAAAFTDAFGVESNAYAEKIQIGEDSAIKRAQIKALELGATAISGCTLSLSEATSGHGMLMISLVGTAVFSSNHNQAVEIVEEYTAYLQAINDIKKNAKYIGFDLPL